MRLGRSICSTLVLVAAACGVRDPAPRIRSSDPCQRIQIQERNWTAENTRTLVGCLVHSPEWSQRIEELDVHLFENTAQWMNEKNSLKQNTSLLRTISPEWGRVLQDARSHLLLSHGDLGRLFHFSASIQKSWSSHFRTNDELYGQLLSALFKMPLTTQEFVNFLQSLGQIFSELPVDGKSPGWSSDLFTFMKMSAAHPDFVRALAHVSPNVNCHNLSLGTSSVRTISPLELGISLFRQNVAPETFVEIFEQGFSFWNEVCQSDANIRQDDVRVLLNFAVDHYEMLQKVAMMNWDQPGVLALGSLFELNEKVRNRDATAKTPLELLSTSPALAELFKLLDVHSPEAQELVRFVPRDPIAYEIFAAVASHPQLGAPKLFSMWMKTWDLFSRLGSHDGVLAEWQQILFKLGPQATLGLGQSIENGRFQQSIAYLQFLLNQKPLPAPIDPTPVPPTRDPPSSPVTPQPAPRPFDPNHAHLYLNECMKQGLTMDQMLQCLKRNGGHVFPESQRWISHFKADWEVLYLLRSYPMEFFLAPETARAFWQPLLMNLHLPIKNGDKLIAWAADGTRLAPADQDLIMAMGRRLFTVLTEVRPSQGTPATKINPKLFDVQGTLRSMDKSYFAAMIYSLVGDPNYLGTRRSFNRLARTTVALNGQTKIPLLTAISRLIADFKIPILGHSLSLELALSTAQKWDSPEDLQRWIHRIEVTLKTVDYALSIAYSSDSELRQTVQLAIGTLQTLQQTADPQDLWNVFAWIREFRLKDHGSRENLNFLLMIHELGLLDSIQDLYEHAPTWLMKGLSTTSPQQAASLRDTSFWIADTFSALFESLDEKQLYDLAVLNHGTQGHFLGWVIQELGDFVMSPHFHISREAKTWLLRGIREVGPPPLKSREALTPLLKFVQEHREQFYSVLRPETFRVAQELRTWEAYPQFVEFLTQSSGVHEWADLIDWLKSPIPQELWNWSLRLERRSFVPPTFTEF